MISLASVCASVSGPSRGMTTRRQTRARWHRLRCHRLALANVHRGERARTLGGSAHLRLVVLSELLEDLLVLGGVGDVRDVHVVARGGAPDEVFTTETKSSSTAGHPALHRHLEPDVEIETLHRELLEEPS